MTALTSTGDRVCQFFLDTNIVLYSVISDDFEKAEKALKLLEIGDYISVQVLNEMISVLRGRKKWNWSNVNAALNAASGVLKVVDLTLDAHRLAVEISTRYNYSIYDANILASAKLSGCDTLWSEDMQHGQMVDGVTILNPFL
jgi:predicted nucleic acid-binding protein